MNLKNSKKVIVLLGLIIFVAAFLRLYRLAQVPPSLSWDEAANGYNAYTVANWGKDEWGKSFPAYFKSFEDDKNPVHIYLTAIPIRILGLSEFSTRLAPAVVGVLCVLIIFFLAEIMLASRAVGLVAALIFAVSPYTLQFSRFSHEAIFAIFFFMLGLLMFLRGLKTNPKLLVVAFLSFGIDILTYHSAKVVVPLILILLIALYIKQLWRVKKFFLLGLAGLGVMMSLFVFNPQLLGTARMTQASIPVEVTRETQAFKATHNELFGRAELAGQRYLTYFSWSYLFETGDAIARHSTGAVGEFYAIDSAFLIIGFVALISLRSKAAFILLAWALLAPVPAAVSGGLTETGHAARALYMMGSWHLIASLGYYRFLTFFKNPSLRIILGVVIIVIAGLEFGSYIIYYYGEYPKRYAIEWQYGMKQIAQYVKEHDGYEQVYITDARSQPYIFMLYYLKTPLPLFLNTVYYNTTQSRPSNLVSLFDKYYFGGWDPIESFPRPGVLYAVTPSQYDGLRHKNEFQLKKLIKYPNGLDAFFLVSLY